MQLPDNTEQMEKVQRVNITLSPFTVPLDPIAPANKGCIPRRGTGSGQGFRGGGRNNAADNVDRTQEVGCRSRVALWPFGSVSLDAGGTLDKLFEPIAQGLVRVT